jgi:hypothetical protein
MVNGMNEIGECGLPAVGEARRFIRNRNTSAGSSYYLDRLPDSGGKPVLRASVNLQFVGPGGAASPQAAQMADRVRQCYQLVSPKLKGPNGEQLTLNLLNNPTDTQSVRRITLIDNSIRADAGTWSAQSNCETMIHETMHILGLCDEYRERSTQWVYYDQKRFVRGPGFNPDEALSDCRVAGPNDSIMSHDCSAFLAVGLTPGQADCPAASASRTSLLFPAQFRTITQPGCIRDNRVFYSCSREAYRTSRGRYGLQRCGLGLPPECRQGGAAWMR